MHVQLYASSGHSATCMFGRMQRQPHAWSATCKFVSRYIWAVEPCACPAACTVGRMHSWPHAQSAACTVGRMHGWPHACSAVRTLGPFCHMHARPHAWSGACARPCMRPTVHATNCARGRPCMQPKHACGRPCMCIWLHVRKHILRARSAACTFRCRHIQPRVFLSGLP